MPVTIVTRSGKGSPLTWNELDANFNNLNTGIDNITISYETGTFTPTITGATTAGVGTYGAQEGKYTKIGNVVTFSIYLNWSAHTGTGTMRIGNLPFSASSNATFSVWYLNFLVGAGKQLCSFINSGINYIRLFASDPSGGAYTEIAMDVAGSITISGSYITT